MGLGHGSSLSWWNLTGGTDSLRTYIATNKVVQSGLVLNLDAGASTSYPGSGISWGDLNGTSGISTATGALPIYNTPDNGAFKTSGTRTDTNASSLVLAIPMDGANNGTTFTDESANIKGSGTAKTVTRQSDAKTLTAVSKFYGSSGYLDGTGDAITVPAGTDFAYGTGNFTIEGWFYQTREPGDTGGGILWSQTVSGRNYFVIFTSSSPRVVTLIFGDGGGSSGGASSAYSLNTWNHFAVVRSGTSIYTFINGVGGVTGSCSYDFSDTSYVPTIGRYTHADAQQYQGYLQDFRVYKGVAKYTANFTPPGNPNNGTLTNGPTYSSANGGSIVFDGTNDFVTAPLSSQFEFGTGEFAVEAWVNLASTSIASSRIIAIGEGAFGASPFVYTGWGLIVFNSSGTRYLQFERYDGAEPIYQGIIPAFSTGQWYHFVATRNASNTLTLYSNGVAISTTASVTQSYNSVNSEPLTIGRMYNGAGGGSYKYVNGSIPVARIYKGKSLTAAEVLQNFNALKGRFVTSITATGGTIVNYTSGGLSYRAHIFTSSGTFQVTNVSGIGNVEYLVVAGGGGGGEDNAGGGGGGGYRTNVLDATSGGGGGAEASFAVSSGPYSIIVGGGGGGGVGGGNRGTSGTNSVFSTITSTGGGGGGGDTSGQRTGAVGGSGGGGAGNSSSAGGLGTANQGFAGGNGLIDANFTSIGGGGGGANAIGANAAGVQAGVGGAGAASSITGASATYGGGGGGGAQNGTAGAGGAGGGGAGATSGVGTPGTSSTGGGGGGGCTAGGDGGNGGSGIVIIRYIISS